MKVQHNFVYFNVMLKNVNLKNDIVQVFSQDDIAVCCWDILCIYMLFLNMLDFVG